MGHSGPGGGIPANDDVAPFLPARMGLAGLAGGATYPGGTAYGKFGTTLPFPPTRASGGRSPIADIDNSWCVGSGGKCPMSDAGTIVAAVRLRKEREIVTFLQERGALSAKAAVQLDPPGLMGKAALRSLLQNSAVIDAASGAYYLDNDAYKMLRSRRRRTIGIMMVLALCVAVAVFLANSASP